MAPLGHMHVTTPEISADRALVRVRTTVRNASGAGAEVEIRSRITDPDGRTVARTAGTAAVADEAAVTHELTVPEPLLWDFATRSTATPCTPSCASGAAPPTPAARPSASGTFRSTPTRASPSTAATQDQGCRPPPRPGRPRRGEQHRRRAPADADHEVDGCQRPAHLPTTPPSPEMIRVCEAGHRG
ncbi:hypothetical protein LT493_15130 [Streptomyces tricolor]|nr:hypothetical protein [Streptomyces tricolor]